MVKIVRFVVLVFEAVFLQFMQGVGVAALLVAAAAGYFRAPSWSVPVFALVFGLGVERLQGESGLLDKAASASERWFFMVLVYFLIGFAGYLAGAYARHRVERSRQPAAPPE